MHPSSVFGFSNKSHVDWLYSFVVTELCELHWCIKIGLYLANKEEKCKSCFIELHFNNTSL